MKVIARNVARDEIRNAMNRNAEAKRLKALEEARAEAKRREG
jgi:hypothetical protein